MVATIAFLLFFIALGVGLFFIALRGGPRGARAALQNQSRRGRRGATTLFLVMYLVLGIAVPAALLIGNKSSANSRAAGTTLSTMDKRGRFLFGNACGSCHTLAAAETTGKVGPNLDQLKPPKPLVLDALAQGRQRGNGTMPANLLYGNDAEAVAGFVGKVAGK